MGTRRVGVVGHLSTGVDCGGGGGYCSCCRVRVFRAGCYRRCVVFRSNLEVLVGAVALVVGGWDVALVARVLGV